MNKLWSKICSLIVSTYMCMTGTLQIKITFHKFLDIIPFKIPHPISFKFRRLPWFHTKFEVLKTIGSTGGCALGHLCYAMCLHIKLLYHSSLQAILMELLAGESDFVPPKSPVRIQDKPWHSFGTDLELFKFIYSYITNQ